MRLNDYKTLICVGSGGVGKTSVSASLGVVAAKSGLKVLVMTIDPSKRLKTSLGLEGHSGAIVKVNLTDSSGELYASILDAEKIFSEFITSSASHEEQAQRLLKNRLYQQLSTTLSGSQEFTSLLQLSKVMTSHEYDLVILDTPPAQHAVDFLEAPKKLQTLFQESVVKWFIGEEHVGFFRKIIAKSTQIVLSALEKITGNQFMKELSDFFESVQSLQATINQKTAMVQELLKAPTTAFILVTSFDEVKLKEAKQMRQYLEFNGFHLVLNIVNRAFPKWFDFYKKYPSQNIQNKNLSQWISYYQQKTELYDRILTGESKIQDNIRLTDHSIDISGLQSIEVLANEIQSQI